MRLLISLWVVGQPQKVVHRNMIKIGQPDKNVRGNIPLTQLVVAVNLLGAVQIVCQLPLPQVIVLAKVTDSLIHIITPAIGYHTANCCIDNYRKMR